jgi:hypothetical protein
MVAELLVRLSSAIVCGVVGRILATVAPGVLVGEKGPHPAGLSAYILAITFAPLARL